MWGVIKMVDWMGRKPCCHRYKCVDTGRNNAAVMGQTYSGLSTEECSACQEYKPEPPQGTSQGRTKFF